MSAVKTWCDRFGKSFRLVLGKTWRLPLANPFPSAIDGVWLWVDGNDPEYRSERRRWRQRSGLSVPTETARYRHVNEIEYSLLSALRYCPWLRRLYVVAPPGHVPRLARRFPSRVRVVPETEVAPSEALPLFNSQALECWLDQIPGLSERFLYFCDDMFIGRPLSPFDWIDSRGRRLLLREGRGQGLAPKPDEPAADSNLHLRAVANSEAILDQHFGYRPRMQIHHQARVTCKTGIRVARRIAGPRWEATARSRFRAPTDIHPYHLAFYCDLYQGRGKIRNDLLAVFAYLDDPAFPEHLARIERLRPPLFCLNDGERAVPEHGASMAAMLRRYYLGAASRE